MLLGCVHWIDAIYWSFINLLLLYFDLVVVGNKRHIKSANMQVIEKGKITNEKKKNITNEVEHSSCCSAILLPWCGQSRHGFWDEISNSKPTRDNESETCFLQSRFNAYKEYVLW